MFPPNDLSIIRVSCTWPRDGLGQRILSTIRHFHFDEMEGAIRKGPVSCFKVISIITCIVHRRSEVYSRNFFLRFVTQEHRDTANMAMNNVVVIGLSILSSYPLSPSLYCLSRFLPFINNLLVKPPDSTDPNCRDFTFSGIFANCNFV
jgi:hypothetical protein